MKKTLLFLLLILIYFIANLALLALPFFVGSCVIFCSPAEITVFKITTIISYILIFCFQVVTIAYIGKHFVPHFSWNKQKMILALPLALVLTLIVPFFIGSTLLFIRDTIEAPIIAKREAQRPAIELDKSLESIQLEVGKKYTLTWTSRNIADDADGKDFYITYDRVKEPKNFSTDWEKTENNLGSIENSGSYTLSFDPKKDPTGTYKISLHHIYWQEDPDTDTSYNLEAVSSIQVQVHNPVTPVILEQELEKRIRQDIANLNYYIFLDWEKTHNHTAVCKNGVINDKYYDIRKLTIDTQGIVDRISGTTTSQQEAGIKCFSAEKWYAFSISNKTSSLLPSNICHDNSMGDRITAGVATNNGPKPKCN